MPEFLATWRIHAAQASAGYKESAAERALMVRMVDAALATRRPDSPGARLPAAPLRFPYRYEYHRLSYAEAPSTAARFGAVLRLVCTAPGVALGAIRLALTGQRRTFDKQARTRHLLKRLGLEKNFVLLPGTATPSPGP